MKGQRAIQVVLWMMLSISTLGAIGSLTSSNHPKLVESTGVNEATILQDEEASGFAAAFARSWLTWTAGETPDAWQARMQPFVTSALLSGSGPVNVGSDHKNQQVDAVFPVRVARTAPNTFLVDVYAETNLHPLLMLSVPISFDSMGHPAVVNWPMIEPVPSAGSPNTTPQGQAASDSVTASLQPVVTSFLKTYLTGKSPDDLVNFVAPGVTIQPLHGLVEWQNLNSIQAFGSSPLTVVATVTVVDPANDTTLPQTYVLTMIQSGGKWFVSSLNP
ncbi:conjugal transfer protein [Alicyclobacillus hesperidum]|uniref:conjugal transfer protein n=1 Tax=Alicyclobacillus hesperidum TaxID=89784 RepID=UPI0002D39621|nr:conjugal transfer protein [Alicyclobacillus hesperidum]